MAEPTEPPATPLSSFTILPLALPSLESLPSTVQPAVHYIYARPHAPKIPDADTPRSLFLSNVPFDADETRLRRLFADQLGGARIERVEFDEEDLIGRAGPSRDVVAKTSDDGEAKRGRKRKRRDVDAALDAPEAQLPPLWDSQLLRSGACAVLVFVDQASRDLAVKAVKRAAKDVAKGRRSAIEWDGGGELGLNRYRARQRLTYPPRDVLLSSVTSYLNAFSELEAARARAQARARSIPDADGFVTVTRGTRTGPARLEQANEALVKEKEKAEKRIGSGFYRFQARERAKEKERQLRREFEEDVRKVQNMKARRKKGIS